MPADSDVQPESVSICGQASAVLKIKLGSQEDAANSPAFLKIGCTNQQIPEASAVPNTRDFGIHGKRKAPALKRKSSAASGVSVSADAMPRTPSPSEATNDVHPVLGRFVEALKEMHARAADSEAMAARLHKEKRRAALMAEILREQQAIMVDTAREQNAGAANPAGRGREEGEGAGGLQPTAGDCAALAGMAARVGAMERTLAAKDAQLVEVEADGERWLAEARRLQAAVERSLSDVGATEEEARWLKHENEALRQLHLLDTSQGDIPHSSHIERWPGQSEGGGAPRLDPPQRLLATSQPCQGSSHIGEATGSCVPREADGDQPRSGRSIPAPMAPRGSSAGGGAGSGGGISSIAGREGRERASELTWHSQDLSTAHETGRHLQGGPWDVPSAVGRTQQQLRQRQAAAAAAAHAEPTGCGDGDQAHGWPSESEAFTESAGSLAAQNRVLRAALESVHQARASASAALEDGEVRIQALTEELGMAEDSSRAAAQASEAHAAALDAELADATHRLEQQSGELAEMEQRLGAATAASAAQQAALQEVEERLEREFHAERETAAELALSMQSEMQDLRAKGAEVAADLRMQLKELQGQLWAARDGASEATSRFEGSSAVAARMDAQLGAAQALVTQLTAQNERQAAELSAAHKRTTALQVDLEQHSREAAGLSDREGALNAAAARAGAAAAEAAAELRQTHQQLLAARDEVQKADRAAAALKVRLGHLEEAARNPGGRTPEQVAALVDEVEALRGALTQTRASQDSCERQARSWRARCEGIRDEVRDLRMKLEEADGRAARWAKRAGAAEAPVTTPMQRAASAGYRCGGFQGLVAQGRSKRQPLAVVTDPGNLVALIDATADPQPSFPEAEAQPRDRVPVSKRLPHLWQSASRQYKETGAYPDPSPLPQGFVPRHTESPAQAEHRWAEDDRACEEAEAAAAWGGAASQLPGGLSPLSAVHTPWRAPHQHKQQHQQHGYLPELILGGRSGNLDMQMYSGGPEPTLAMTPVGWPGTWGGGRPGSAAAGRRAVAAVALQLAGPSAPSLAPDSTLGDDLNEVAALLNGLTAV